MTSNSKATYTPIKFAPIYATVRGVIADQADIEERAPICGLSKEKAIAYAKAAYGEDAGIENDETREWEVV